MTTIPAPGADLATERALLQEALDAIVYLQRVSGSQYHKVTADKIRAFLAAVPASEPPSECRWPNCESEATQQKLAEEVAASLFGEPPQPLHVMAPFAPPAGQQDASFSDSILHAIYRACQRGDSPERMHAAVMALVGKPEQTSSAPRRGEQAPTGAAPVSGMPDLASDPARHAIQNLKLYMRREAPWPNSAVSVLENFIERAERLLAPAAHAATPDLAKGGA